jgi:effector-binding domain-containing protein
VLVHAGSYDTLIDSYRTLGTWVATNAVASDLPVREHYLVGAAQTDAPDSYRTEICWPVQPVTGS